MGDIRGEDQALKERNEQWSTKGRQILTVRIPAVINRLSVLLDSEPWTSYKPPFENAEIVIDPVCCHADIADDDDTDSAENGGDEPGKSKKCHMKIHAAVPINTKLVELSSIVSDYLMETLDDVSNLRAWVNLLVPKVEDGNNFGVGIQNMVMQTMIHVEKRCGDGLESITSYHNKRGHLVAKLTASPHVADYRQAIVFLDRHAFFSFRLLLISMAHTYSSLYQKMMKNLDKIEQPRSNNASNMY